MSDTRANRSQTANSPNQAAGTPGTLIQEWVNAFAVPLHNLPPRPAGIVGREEDLGRVRQLLEEHRLVTLVGPGGVGKSCLALQLAWESLPAFQHGVYLVPLESLASPDYVVFAIAEALGFTFHTPVNPQTQLLDYLWGREMLLVLDNLEHLLPAADLIGHILQRAEGVKIAVTSRERLCLREEWVFEVKGLRFPPDETAADVPAYSAAQVFLQSARRARADFSPAGQDMPHVARICRLVDGLPLALELAGAWVRALPCPSIAREIERDLDFLTGHWRDMPERHRSLRAVHDHSWTLLDERERGVCRALSVLRGGITRLGAGQIAGASLTELSRLVDRSFLRWNAGLERYEMHPFLRQYAEEKLDADPAEAERVRERHCAYFAAFLHDQEGTLVGHGQQQALAGIEAEIDNVRQAWKWAAEHASVEHVEQSLESLYQFYFIRSRSQEGLAAFSQALECLTRSGAASERLQRLVCKLQARLGRFARHLGDTERALELLQKSLEAFSAWGDHSEMAACLNELANVSIIQCDCLRDETQLDQALALVRAAQNRAHPLNSLCQLEADILYNQGRVIKQGNSEKIEKLEQARHIYHTIGDRRGESNVLNFIGITLSELGNYNEARSRYEQALAISREINDRHGESRELTNFGNIANYLGHYTEALIYSKQALRIAQEIGDRQIEAIILWNLGVANTKIGDYINARSCCEQACRIFDHVGSRRYQCGTMCDLGKVEQRLGNRGSAQALYQQALQIARELGERLYQGHALVYLGHLSVDMGDLEEAASSYRQALALRRELGMHALAAEAIACLARVSLMQGDMAQAQAYVDEIVNDAYGELVQSLDDPCETHLVCYRILQAGRDPRAQAILKTAHDLLQERAARISDEEMRRSYLENVPAHREILAAFQSQALGGGASNEALLEPLTGRERDVLRLIAAGLTNQEIAEALVVEVGTVKSHAHNVYAKLGVRNRTQALARVRELGLLSDSA